MDIIPSLLILVAMGISGWALYVQTKKNPDHSLTHIILSAFRSSFTGWFLAVLAVATLGECLAAATTHGEGAEINPIARIIAHVSLGIFQFISAMGITAAIQQLIEAIKTRNGRAAFLNVIIANALFIGIFFAPYMNLLIMASTLGEVDMLNFFFFSLKSYIPYFGPSEIQVMAKAVRLGLKPDTSALQLLSSPIILMLATIGTHMLIMIVEICHSLLTDDKVYVQQVGGPTPANAPAPAANNSGGANNNPPNPSPNNPRNTSVTDDKIKGLLTHFGLSGASLDKAFKDALQALKVLEDSGLPDDKTKLFYIIEDAMKLSDKVAANQDVKQDVQQLFEKAIDDRGFGIILPNV